MLFERENILSCHRFYSIDLHAYIFIFNFPLRLWRRQEFPPRAQEKTSYIWLLSRRRETCGLRTYVFVTTDTYFVRMFASHFQVHWKMKVFLHAWMLNITSKIFWRNVEENYSWDISLFFPCKDKCFTNSYVILFICQQVMKI